MTIDLRTLIQQGQTYEQDADILKSGAAAAADFLKIIRTWLLDCVHFGRYLPDGSADRRALQGQVDYWTSLLLQADHPVPGIDRIDPFNPEAGVPLADEKFPYYGLSAATDKVASRFVGREAETEAYSAHLAQYPALLIISESGGGKSSLAMAGVIPALRCAHPQWLFAPSFTPGAHPCAALKLALEAALELPLPEPLEASTIDGALDGRTMLLFIDQLEEILTVGSDTSEQRAFCMLLSSLVDSGHVRLLATLRTDHYERLANSDACQPLHARFTQGVPVKALTAMTFEQIRAVILKPAREVGLRFVPTLLVDRLASETANLPGGLPRLQFALQRLWELRPKDAQGQRLDLINEASFAALPSVSKALATVAESVFTQLSEPEQRACERLMLELAVLDDQLELPLRRRCIERDVIASLTAEGLVDEKGAKVLIDRFIEQKLLVRTGRGEASQIEVAHESLFRYWPTFDKWIQSVDVRQRFKDLRIIRRDASEWMRNGQASDYQLLRGEVLQRACKYRAENWLDAASRSYCDACEKAAGRHKHLWRAICALLIVTVPGCVYLSLRSWSLQQRLAQTSITYASLTAQLPPLEALDVAYTLERMNAGSYVAPLSHALDRLKGSEVKGERQQGSDFSAGGGHALLQLVHKDLVHTTNGDSLPVEARIIPIGTDGKLWPEPVIIKADEAATADGRLASVNVGPPVPGNPGTRLVVMFFLAPGDDGVNLARNFRQVMVYEIHPDTPPVRLLQERLPKATTRISEVAFDASGLAAVVATLQDSQNGVPKGKLLELRRLPGSQAVAMALKDAPKEPGRPQSTNGRDVVNVVAYGNASGTDPSSPPVLVTGRLDGSVFCGDVPVAQVDRSTILSLQVAGAGPTFVVRRKANMVDIGSCATPKIAPTRIDLKLNDPQSMLLRDLSPPRGADAPRSRGNQGIPARPVQLSLTDGRKLCRFDWDSTTTPSASVAKDCWVADLEIDQAVPVVMSNAPTSGDFIALPDRKLFWTMRLHDNAPIYSAESDARGVPVVMPPPDDVAEAPQRPTLFAVSPDNRYRARIVVGMDGGRTVEREAGKGRLERVHTNFDPIAVTLNNQGAMVVLESYGQLGIFDAKGNAAKDVRIKIDGSCLKLDPSGRQAIVAGRDGIRTIVNLSDGGVQTLGAPGSNNKQSAPGSASDQKAPPISACAIGSKNETVTGLSDGTVLYHADKNDKKKTLTALAQFRMPGPVLDVSIDATGRFVAAVGSRANRICPGGAPGYPVRVWDLQRGDSSYPVASACLPNAGVMAIGPLQQDGLPVYAVSDGRARVFSYACPVCTAALKGREQEISKSLLETAESGFQARKLDKADLKTHYGIEP